MYKLFSSTLQKKNAKQPLSFCQWGNGGDTSPQPRGQAVGLAYLSVKLTSIENFGEDTCPTFLGTCPKAHLCLLKWVGDEEERVGGTRKQKFQHRKRQVTRHPKGWQTYVEKHVSPDHACHL